MANMIKTVSRVRRRASEKIPPRIPPKMAVVAPAATEYTYSDSSLLTQTKFLSTVLFHISYLPTC